MQNFCTLLLKPVCIEFLSQKRERLSEEKSYILTVIWKEERNDSAREWELQSAELSKIMWRLYCRGWNRVKKMNSWRLKAGQKVYFGMEICWNTQKVNQSSILIEYEWFINISQSSLQEHKQNKKNLTFLAFDMINSTSHLCCETLMFFQA